MLTYIFNFGTLSFIFINKTIQTLVIIVRRSVTAVNRHRRDIVYSKATGIGA